MILERKEKKKKRWKIREKMDEIGVWLGGGGGEKIGEAALFSLWVHQNSIIPNRGENTRENKSLIFGQLPLANTNVHHYAFFPFFLFFS